MLRPAIAGQTSDAEARAYLQTRLAKLISYLFVAYAVLLVFLQILYRSGAAHEPELNGWVYAITLASLVIMAVMWRGMLIRGEQSYEVLHRLDATFTVGSGFVFGAAAALANDFRPSGYVCLMYQCFTLLTRALVVPSTGRRTAVLSILAFVPMSGTAVFLANWTTQEVAGPAYFAGYAVVAVVTVLLAWAGSQIIYEMRSEARAAQYLGRYKLVRRVDQGGLGEVYLANHLTLRRPTAVKLLRPDRVGAENVRRFEREVQRTSLLTHPNTVAVFDYGHMADGSFYYAMEYLGGGLNLEHLVRDHGAQPAGRVVAILSQVCGALQEAHEAGFIHRDIKPANIMLCQRGGVLDVAKVVDFGIAELITEERGDATILGTPAYLAPEAFREATNAPAIDLYAVGCVGYFLLAGKRAFDGPTTADFARQHAADEPPPLPARVPPVLASLIARCLAKRASERPTSAAELAESLAGIATTDWSEADRRAWWRDFVPKEPDPALSTDTLTVPIDLATREEAA